MRHYYISKKSMNILKGVFQIIVGLIFVGSNPSFAQITQPIAWTKAYDQVSGTCTGYSLSVAAGLNRMLIVGITNTTTGSATQANPTTISYGGVTLTLATTNGTTSGRTHTWLYYLKDNAVMDGTSRSLLVTLANTQANISVWYSVFAGVDQAPASYTVGTGIGTAAGSGPTQLSAAMAVNANQQAVYISSMYCANTTVPTYTINANWTSGGNNSNNNGTIGWKTEVAKRTISGANTTDNATTSAITPANQIRWAMSAMSLPMYVPPTLTVSNPTTSVSAASVCASSLNVPIHAFNIISSGTTGTLTNFQFTTTGSYVASDITNFKIWWNSTNSLASATLLATDVTPTGPGIQTFTAFSLNIPVGTYYFWITADIASTVGVGNTLTVSGSNSTDMTSTAILAGGPTTASGTQTLSSAPTAVLVSGGGTFCGGTTTLNASGGTGGTIYWQNTTSGGTSTATPSSSQTVGASGTYYYRAYDGTSCWGTEGSTTVTITTVPIAVTVSGGGTFCGTATLTATGGTGGTIYWQNTTSGGTSTATPSSSQAVAASGTYYFRALNGTCWGAEGSATVTINPLPTAVTVAGGGNFCSVPSVTLTASGGTGGTIYWQNTTTGGTSTATPSSSQSVSASGTYYFRSRTALGCWGTQGSATVTMGTTPTAVTVTGGGSFCATSATLNASGGVGGTIYWQNTTTNGTSITTPSSSQTVAANGTYYFRARDAGTCWGTQGSAVVTLNAIPTITLGTNPTICSGVTSANLTYSATTGTPNQYSIVYDATALTQGFINVTNATLIASQIVLVVPAGAIGGTYNYTVTVRNSTTGCVSSSYAKTITLIPLLGSPGTITGAPVVAPMQTGVLYSITAMTGATSYTWTVPTGWTITSGNGTNSIVVTTGIGGQNGNITVYATNSCSTSSTPSLAVSVTVPHNSCSQCHITHTSYGTALAIVNGNANLCISCHNPAGTAYQNPMDNAMKAVPGVSGTSHTWDALAVNYKYGASLPANTDMLTRLDNNHFICSTCHNQHSVASPNFLRMPNDGDALCKECHSVRNVGRYVDNPGVNIGSHPVGLTYNGSDPRFFSSPQTPMTLLTAKVECSSCHQPHNSTSTDGYILRMNYSDDLCKKCHVSLAPRRSLVHEGMSCITCHITHKAGLTNIMLIRDTINTPNSGLKPVVFVARASGSDYGAASSPFTGVCEACHTATDHYSNTSGVTSDARHVPATQTCITCHPHEDAFYAQTNCLDCHKAITDKAGVGPSGGRRQIVDANGNGTGLGGDFKRTSHHVTGSVPNATDCILCHYMGDHMRGAVKLMDPDSGYLKVITYNPLVQSSVENFCINCHDADGAGGDVTPFSDNVTVPIFNKTLWTASAHKAHPYTCMDCHDNGHGSNKSTLLAPYDYTGLGTGTDVTNEEEGFCFSCHGAGGEASVKVHLSFANTNTATAIRKHDVTASYRKHTNEEYLGTSFGGANRHVECVDCHTPHSAKAYTATVAPTIYNELIGASGVNPIYTGAGAPTGFTYLDNATYEYQVCFKCHSSYTTLPSYLPAGWSGTADAVDGLKKLTTGGTNTQIADSRDMAQEFNPSNASFHPIIAAGTNLNINAATFQTGYSYTSRMYCTDCHNDNQNATAGYGRGPHGSQNLHILDAGTGGNSGYKSVHNAVNTSTTDFCTKCHQAASYISGNTSSRYGYHYYHVANKTQEGCYICHDSHGSEQLHLINFSRNQTGGACITAVTTNTQAAFVHAAGTAANTCNVTCHGTSHGGGKSYNPAYN